MSKYDTGMDRVFAAREFAIEAHGDQKYGNDPYVAHLDEVATLCLHHLPGIGVRESSGKGFSDFVPLIVDCLIASYLHDVLEDTKKTEEDVRSLFGDRAARAALALSDPPGKNRRERKSLLHARLAALHEGDAVGAVVLATKAMDRLANCRRCRADGNTSLLDMYRKEAVDFRQAVFRVGICRQAWVEIDRICS